MGRSLQLQRCLSEARGSKKTAYRPGRPAGYANTDHYTDTILRSIAPTLRKWQLQVPTNRRDLPPIPGPGIGATLLAPQVCVTRARGRGWAGLPSLSQLCDPEEVTISECQFSLLQDGMVSWTLLRGQEDKTRNEKVAGSTLSQCKTNHSGKDQSQVGTALPWGCITPFSTLTKRMPSSRVVLF